MNLNFEILQYFVYKKILKNSQKMKVLEECERLNIPAEKYMIANGYCDEIRATTALAEGSLPAPLP